MSTKRNMPALQPYEYAVIRLVPRVEREEFVNVGVILYCKDQRFLAFDYAMDDELMKRFAPSVDLDDVRANLRAMDRICIGGFGCGPIGELELGERFRWLTATRSTVLQPSPVHIGYTADAQGTLDHIFRQLVFRESETVRE